MSAISVREVSKKFKVYYDKGQSFKEKLLFRNRNYYEERNVIKGISFEVAKGEAIGLIGENGCGKSTLLKMLSRIMYPDSGEIAIQGRVSSLIELGAGFHPDMSGKENIYTNASIFGLTKKQIDKRLNKIIEFSELEKFIDNPVRTYSSGMYMRLAFAVAINVDADILLIDEILAVGDAAFQEKCFDKLREIKRKGTTIVIVSHSLSQIEQICERSIWIDKGVIQKEGCPVIVHSDYMRYMETKYNKEGKKSSVEHDAAIGTSSVDINTSGRLGNKDIEILDISIKNKNSFNTSLFKTGEQMNIVLKYKMNKNIDDPVIGIGIFRKDGLECYGTNTSIDNIRNIKLNESGEITFTVPSINLMDGEYFLDAAIHEKNGNPYDYIKKAKDFSVMSEVSEVGIIRLEHVWGGINI